MALTMVRFPQWPCTKKYRLRTVWAFLSVLKENLHPFTVHKGVVGSEVQVERERVHGGEVWGTHSKPTIARHCPPPPSLYYLFIFKRPMYR